MKTSGYSGFLRPGKSGFTLIELILVVVVVVIVSGIALPYFAGSYRGTKVRSAARTIDRITRYAHAMAILREETLTVVLNHETMEIFMGGSVQNVTSTADGELDQEVLKRLGYIEDGASKEEDAGIEKEIHRFLPDHLSVRDFEKNWTEEDDPYEDLYLIHFYPNGQCDWFRMELEDNRGMRVQLENDPVSGKMYIEFKQ
jgi:prepilin-type N-terminal cleavage/methylation domain-containing protein